MATEIANGHSATNGGSGELSAAQKLMQKHDEAHKATMEEVPDEADLKHPEAPHSGSILESKDEPESVPTWTQPISAKSAGKQKAQEEPVQAAKPSLDTQSHDLFPELGGAPKSQNAPSIPSFWSAKKSSVASAASANGANGTTHTNGTSTPTSGTATPTPTPAARGGPNSLSIPGRHSEKISLAPTQLLSRTQLKKPVTDILKDINKKSKANVTMTTGNGGVLWLNAVGPTEACRQALKDVVEQIGSKQSIKVAIPRSARAHIIGKQGSTIKALQEKTGARIQMPKSDETTGPVDDDDDEATVDVVIEGNALSAEMARKEVEKIAGERTATVNQKIRNIPAEFYPFIAGPNNAQINAMEQGKNLRVNVPVHHTWTRQPPPQAAPAGQVNFLPPAADNHITLSGDRLAVQEARGEIERLAQEFQRQLALEQLAINKGRHQFIIGDRGIPVQDFFAETGCAIILPGDDEDELITIIGPADQVQNAMEKAMDLASSMHSTNFDISRQHRNAPGGAANHARNLTRYLQRRKEIERLEKAHSAHIVTPILSEGSAPWELYSRDGKNAIRAQSEITNIVNGHPPSRMANMDIDPFFHQHIRKHVLPKIQQDYGVYTVIPDDSETNAPVLLVFEGGEGTSPEYQIPRTQPSPAEVQAFQKSLEEAQKYILDIISGQEQIVTRQIDVPQVFHEKLRRFIKKEQESKAIDQIPVRVSATGTVVTLRGTSTAVESLAAKVNSFVEQAIEDEKERGFTLSFDFPQKHANQLIGKGGSNIRELREKFDVEIQVDDGKVELKGPKAKAEAAKAHITSLGRHWADESTHTLKIDPKFHRELIGAQGNQINKLQTRYKVQIHFPRSAKPVRDDQSVDGATGDATPPKVRRPQAEDEVIVRGPSKGADEARDEILSLLQYLRDNSHSATVSVQQSQLPSLIGQGGKVMDELRQESGAKIDVPGSREAKDPSGLVDIQIRGTKAQVLLAKKLIEEKKNVFDQSVSTTLEVDKKHHRALIGAGGSNLREMVVKAGGPSDPREQARTVQFPKADADGNTIKIAGNKDVVDNIIAAMKEMISQRESQVVETIEVPAEKHRSLIGRGGETKKSLESQFNVSIDIPRQGSGQTAVKISGQPTGVESAKSHILGLVKDEEGETVQVPRAFHHIISDNGQFFRKMKNDHQVTVDHAGHKIPAKTSAPSNTRATGGALPLITDDQDEDAHSWNVVSVSPSEIDGEIPWILRGPPANVAKAKASLAAALEQAQRNTTTGYLVLPDPQTYRYVIGQGGSKVNSIRKQTGCKINVPRDQAKDEAIEISGSADGVEQAKELILQAVKEGGAANGSRA